MSARRIALLCVIAALAAAPLALGGYRLTLMNYIGIGAIVALGLVLLTGVGGLTSFGQAALVGIGAYATAWLTTEAGASPWLGLIAALAFSGGAAAILGAVTLRLGGHFLPLSTIAWGLAIYFLFGNVDMLGRHNGIGGIPPVTIGPLSFAPAGAVYYLIWGALALAMWLCANLLDSREGRAISSLRGGAAMAESLGIDTFRVRLVVFVFAGVLAGLSGWLYAHMNRFISPAPFDVRPGIEYLFMAVAGGSGHIAGAVVGAALVTVLKDLLQEVLPRLTRHAGQMEVVIFGVLFIVLLQRARGGVVPFIAGPRDLDVRDGDRLRHHLLAKAPGLAMALGRRRNERGSIDGLRLRPRRWWPTLSERLDRRPGHRHRLRSAGAPRAPRRPLGEREHRRRQDGERDGYLLAG